MTLSHSNYLRLIPSRFRKRSIADKHRFAVNRANWYFCDLLEADDGDLQIIRPAVYCEYYDGKEIIPLLIDEEQFPVESARVMQLGRLQFGGDRTAKYLALFKVYESLCENTDMYFAAIRHALTHATTVLTRPKTVEALTSAFGTVHIDLDKYRHQIVFWHRYGELLVLVDSIVGDQLASIAEFTQMPSGFRRPLTMEAARYHYPEKYKQLLSNKSPS